MKKRFGLLMDSYVSDVGSPYCIDITDDGDVIKDIALNVISWIRNVGCPEELTPKDFIDYFVADNDREFYGEMEGYEDPDEYDEFADWNDDPDEYEED